MSLDSSLSDDPERTSFLVPTMNMVNAYGKVVIALADITGESRQLYEDLETCPNPGKMFNVGYMLETSRAFCTSCDPTQGRNEWSTRGCRVSITFTFDLSCVYTQCFSALIRTVQKWVQCIPMVLFTHDVKKIKSAADKKCLKNATCKRSLSVKLYRHPADQNTCLHWSNLSQLRARKKIVWVQTFTVLYVPGNKSVLRPFFFSIAKEFIKSGLKRVAIN